MTPRARSGRGGWGRRGAAVGLLAALAFGAWPGEAEAQWGFGYGFGWGNPAFRYVPSPTDYLNQRSLVNQGNARGPTSNNVYAGSSNAYFNNLRSDGLGDRFDYTTRRPASQARMIRPDYGSAPLPAPSPPPGGAGAAQAGAAPIAPITSFFNREEKVVWPADAPTAGELGPKRETSDAATREVFREYTQQGLARVATATDARQKLLDYGRPALRLLRENSTAGIADAFNVFLLSLYDSIAQATTTAPRRPTPR